MKIWPALDRQPCLGVSHHVSRGNFDLQSESIKLSKVSIPSTAMVREATTLVDLMKVFGIYAGALSLQEMVSFMDASVKHMVEDNMLCWSFLNGSNTMCIRSVPFAIFTLKNLELLHLLENLSNDTRKRNNLEVSRCKGMCKNVLWTKR